MIKKSLITNYWLLITILIIASFLRLYNLNLSIDGLPPGLYPDEAMNGNNAVEAWETNPLAGGWKVFYPENHGREGLFINIQSLFVAAFGSQPWALRLPSAIFGILTVLGLYLLAKELFKNKNLALLAAFLLAVSFWHINFSRIGFRAIMAPFFLTWAFYFLIKAIYTNRCALFSILGGLLYGLGFHSYIAYRATPLLALIILLYLLINVSKKQKLRIVKIFAIFSAGAILAALPLGIYFLKNPADFFGRTAQISIFSTEGGFASGGDSFLMLKKIAINTLKTAGMFNFIGDSNWRHNIAEKPLLFWPVGILFLIGIYVAGQNLIQKLKENQNNANTKILHFAFCILVYWLIVTAIPIIVSNEGLPHALRSILMAPPVFILAALGGMKIYKLLESYIKSKFIIHALLFIILSLFVFEAYYTYFIRWGENPDVKNAFNYNDIAIARQLNALPKETPKYIILSDVSGEIKRDNPIFLQSILFLTDTYTDEKRAEKNFFYLTEEQFKVVEIPENSSIIKLH